MNDWKPISTAPKDGTEVLLLVPIRHKKGLYHIGSYFFGDDGRWWNNIDNFVSSPTHWMSRPNLPVGIND